MGRWNQICTVGLDDSIIADDLRIPIAVGLAHNPIGDNLTIAIAVGLAHNRSLGVLVLLVSPWPAVALKLAACRNGPVVGFRIEQGAGRFYCSRWD